ncbi:MAG: sugar phosphate nucleotidyltransferase [Caulobacteraceae bacterium]
MAVNLYVAALPTGRPLVRPRPFQGRWSGLRAGLGTVGARAPRTRGWGMKCVILAGGLGTRIAEETGSRPKPMIEIGGRPILWHIMKLYSRTASTTSSSAAATRAT